MDCGAAALDVRTRQAKAQDLRHHEAAEEPQQEHVQVLERLEPVFGQPKVGLVRPDEVQGRLLQGPERDEQAQLKHTQQKAREAAEEEQAAALLSEGNRDEREEGRGAEHRTQDDRQDNRPRELVALRGVGGLCERVVQL